MDIWSFGCLIFQLFTAEQLFVLEYSIFPEGADEHLLLFTQRLGPLPDELYKQWETSSLYFTPKRVLYNSDTGIEIEPKGPIRIMNALGYFFKRLASRRVPQTMEERFDYNHPDLTREEARKVKQLIRWILQYDSAKRPSAAEVLQDPWFCEIE